MIPNTNNTTLLFDLEGMFNDIPARYQTWQFDGIRGENILFNKKDLKRQTISQIIKAVRASKLAQTHKPITVSHNPPGHVCLIFNFDMGPGKADHLPS